MFKAASGRPGQAANSMDFAREGGELGGGRLVGGTPGMACPDWRPGVYIVPLLSLAASSCHEQVKILARCVQKRHRLISIVRWKFFDPKTAVRHACKMIFLPFVGRMTLRETAVALYKLPAASRGMPCPEYHPQVSRRPAPQPSPAKSMLFAA